MKVVVVFRADGRAEADRDLEAGDDRGEQLFSAPPVTSVSGERGGDDDGARMDDRDTVDIIHLDDVRKRAVRERRRFRRSAHGLAEDESAAAGLGARIFQNRAARLRPATRKGTR